MATAKDLRVAPIARADANALVKRVHYSGRIVNNSQLHLGVFIGGRLEGAMQFGPSMDKRKLQGLVSGTLWNGFIELNRLAFSEKLPRNSESRALGVALKMIRKAYPHIEWVVSFADATQCGDGTIYRASGFVLTSIKANKQIWEMPDGHRISGITATATATARGGFKAMRQVVTAFSMTKGQHVTDTGSAGTGRLKACGGVLLPGFQLRYIRFLNPAARARLTVPELPYSAIAEAGARMYRGELIGADKMRVPSQRESGSEILTSALQS